MSYKSKKGYAFSLPPPQKKNNSHTHTALGTFKLFLSSLTLHKLGQIISASQRAALKVRVTIYCKMVGTDDNEMHSLNYLPSVLHTNHQMLITAIYTILSDEM